MWYSILQVEQDYKITISPPNKESMLFTKWPTLAKSVLKYPVQGEEWKKDLNAPSDLSTVSEGKTMLSHLLMCKCSQVYGGTTVIQDLAFCRHMY